MKTKLLSIIFASFSLLTTVSCRKDNDDFSINNKNETAQVNVKVLKNGKLVNGSTVYLFKSGPSSGFFSPFYSNRSSITEDGVAVFDLKNTFDLEVINSQTTLYFAVFDNNKNLLGYSGVTIRKGETKTITINID